MSAVVVRWSPLSAAARSWVRPLPVCGIALAMVGGGGLVAATHAFPPASTDDRVSVAMAIALLNGLSSSAIGYTWKRHVSPPHARLAPGFFSAHARCAATALAVIFAMSFGYSMLCFTAVGWYCPLSALAIAVVPTVLGGFSPFSSLSVLFGLWPMVMAAGFTQPIETAIVQSLSGERIDLAWTFIALGAVVAAHGVQRAIAIDEDEPWYRGKMRRPPVTAMRRNQLMRMISAWNRPRPAVRSSALAASTVAWGVHRARLFRGMSGLAKMGAISFGLGALLFSHQPLGIACIVVVLAPTWVQLFFMSPAFAQARALEALRPASRRRDIASMLLGLSLAQARDVALVAAPVAACIALRAPDQLAGVAFAAAIATASAPMISAVGLALSTARSDGRRQAAIFTLFAIMGMILSATSEQIASGRSGWILAAAAIADLVVVPLAWRRLIRIDIE